MSYSEKHEVRLIVLSSLHEIDGEGNLYDVHEQSKKHIGKGLKIDVIYHSLKNMDGIVSIEESEEFNPSLRCEITDEDTVETIYYMYNN